MIEIFDENRSDQMGVGGEQDRNGSFEIADDFAVVIHHLWIAHG